MIFLTKPHNFVLEFTVVSSVVEVENKFLLLKRNLLKPQGGDWGLPAGKKDSNEFLLQAMTRELYEETSIKIKVDQLVQKYKFYVTYPDYSFVYYMFGLDLKIEPYITLNPAEHTSFQWVTLEESKGYKLIKDLDECLKLFYKIK